MKHLFTTIMFLLLTATIVTAQAPQRINFQGIARNTNGTAMANRTLGLRLSVLTGSAAGAAQYVETHTVTTNAYGLYNLLIGGGTVVSGIMTGITWGTATKFIKVEIDPNGGTAYSATTTTQFVSVPYALNAPQAWVDGTGVVYNTSDLIGIGTSAPAYGLDVASSARFRNSVGIQTPPNTTFQFDVLPDSRFQNDVSVGGSLGVGSNAAVAGSLTVNNNKGVAYNSASATNLKIFPFTTLTFGAILPGFGLSAEGAIAFNGGFTGTPRVFVGDIDVTGGTVGELYRVQLILYGCSTTAGVTNCKARLLNTSPTPVNYNITWNCVAIGF
jgi:hypothetical protein